MKENFVTIVMAGFVGLTLTASCRHAEVVFERNPPSVCEKLPGSRQCKKEMEDYNQSLTKTGEKHTLAQNFFFFGLYPRNQLVDVSGLCPTGVHRLHQYTSILDGILEQATFTIYSPRTLDVECNP